MNVRFFVAALIILFHASHALSAGKNNFGRETVLVEADPAIIDIINAVTKKVGNKALNGKPSIRLSTTRKALKRICLGEGAAFPDMIATTREMNKVEFERCQRVGTSEIVMLKIGYEALVVATNKKNTMELDLNQRNLYKALARDVPDEVVNIVGVVTENPYKTWKDIDKDAPKIKIKAFGPMDDEIHLGLSVKELGLEGGCRTWDWIPEMKNIQKSHRLYRAICHVTRRDGQYEKVNSDKTTIAKQLLNTKNSIGLMSFNRWKQQKDKLKAYPINEMPATIGTISKGLYPLSRPYYVYIKISSLKKVQGLSHLMGELVNEKTLGPDGYLADMGLVSMPKRELKREVMQAAEFVVMTAPDES